MTPHHRYIAATLAATATAAALSGGCGTADSEPPARPSARAAAFSERADFADVYSSDATSDGRGTALAVAGRLSSQRSARTLAVRLYTRSDDADWRRAPRLADAFDRSMPVSVAYRRSAPCVGYQTPRNGTALGCLSGGRWSPLPRAGLPRSPSYFARLTARGPRLVALYATPRSAAVYQLTGRSWHRLGRPVPTGGAIVALGENLRAGAPVDLALTDVRTKARRVWTFDGSRWSKSAALRGIGAGPMPSGPVRVGRAVYLAVVDASKSPWVMSVHRLAGVRWSAARQRLNQTSGNAQGTIRENDGVVWVSWQESRPLQSGAFATAMFAQPLTPGSRPTALWSGESIGPGSIETIDATGGIWAMYMPAAPDARGLTLDVSHIAQTQRR